MAAVAGQAGEIVNEQQPSQEVPMPYVIGIVVPDQRPRRWPGCKKRIVRISRSGRSLYGVVVPIGVTLQDLRNQTGSMSALPC
jgi:hypothetical protein